MTISLAAEVTRSTPDSAPLAGTEALESAAGPGLPASVELARIAVYDPGLPISGRPSFDFSPDFERSVRTGEYARAMTVMSRRQRAV